MKPTLLIREALSEDDRRRVYRFRYDVYVTEMRRDQHYADHDAKTIEEPYDRAGKILVAEVGPDLVGTMRCNYVRDGHIGEYPEHYSFHLFDGELWDKFMITTKLMVRKGYRASPLGVRLACAGYEMALRDGIRYDFIDCNPHLEPFFARLGYRSYRARLNHPEYGDVLPLYLDFTDLDHLRAVGSPFARILSAWQDSSAAVPALATTGGH